VLHGRSSVAAGPRVVSADFRHFCNNPAVTDPAPSDLPPPVAPARPTTLQHRGDERVDPWYWLRDRDDPEVLAYLESENAYTEQAVAHLESLRHRLYDEIVGRVQETDASAPTRHGGYEYFVRTVAGAQ
jgi:oligopeptidase B